MSTEPAAPTGESFAGTGSEPADPPDFRVPTAPDWYRFALQSPSVAVVLAAPANRVEVNEDLGVLDTAGPLSPSEYAPLAEHGERVRRHAGRFP